MPAVDQISAKDIIGWLVLLASAAMMGAGPFIEATTKAKQISATAGAPQLNTESRIGGTEARRRKTHFMYRLRYVVPAVLLVLAVLGGWRDVDLYTAVQMCVAIASLIVIRTSDILVARMDEGDDELHLALSETNEGALRVLELHSKAIDALVEGRAAGRKTRRPKAPAAP